jgi:hypothetical protein
MADKIAIYANGWGGEIYATHLKSGSWTIKFEIDVGDYGRVRKTVANLRSPKQFVHALYVSDHIEMDPAQVEVALSALYEREPAFAVACSIYNQTTDGETDFDEEDYLRVYPSFLRSNFHFPPDFGIAKELGIGLFSALIDCNRRGRQGSSLEINGVTFQIIWDNQVTVDLQEFQISKAVAEHFHKSEWKKLTGHSHAAIGNGKIGEKIRKFVTDHLSEHGSLPIGDFSVEGIAVKFNP